MFVLTITRLQINIGLQMDNIIIKNPQGSESVFIPDRSGFTEELTEELTKKIVKILIEKLGLTKESDSKAIEKKDIHDGLTITETSKYLGVSKVTVHRLMNDGEITYFKIRRRSFITKTSIKKYIEKNTYTHNEG